MKKTSDEVEEVKKLLRRVDKLRRTAAFRYGPWVEHLDNAWRELRNVQLELERGA